MELQIYSVSGEERGKVSVPTDLLAEKYNENVLQQAVVAERHRLHRGTHSTKVRSTISGSTKKLWRQKGTGRARVGSIKTPIWRHGPVVFGPLPRSYEVKVNKKVKLKATRIAFVQRLREEGIKVIDQINLEDHKTKSLVEILKNHNFSKGLIIVDSMNTNMALASRNLPSVNMVEAKNLRAIDLVMFEQIMITNDALGTIFERIKNEK